jgi:hypothetical protein
VTVPCATPNTPFDLLQRDAFLPVLLWTVPSSGSAGSRLADFAASRETVNQASLRQPNWDGDGALPISAETNRNALAALRILEAVVPAPEITPNPNGTLSFEWETDAGVGYLEIGRTRYSFYLKPVAGPAILHDGSTENVSSTLGLLVDDLLYEKPQTAQIVTDLTYCAPNV